MLTIINIKIYVYVGMFVKLDILQNLKKINLNVFFKKNNFKNDLYTTITNRFKYILLMLMKQGVNHLHCIVSDKALVHTLIDLPPFISIDCACLYPQHWSSCVHL